MPNVPRLNFPVAIDPVTGHLAEVEQDSPDDLVACVEVVCRTVIGERDEHPDLGITELALSRIPVDLDRLTNEIVSSEPRARVLLAQDPALFDETVQTVVAQVGGFDG